MFGSVVVALDLVPQVRFAVLAMYHSRLASRFSDEPPDNDLVNMPFDRCGDNYHSLLHITEKGQLLSLLRPG